MKVINYANNISTYLYYIILVNITLIYSNNNILKRKNCTDNFKEILKAINLRKSVSENL